jgi:hypothetical protein
MKGRSEIKGKSPRRSIWIKFRRLHPFSKEPFIDSMERELKWLYHIAQTEGAKNYTRIVIKNDELLKIRQLYRVSAFNEFPPETAAVYEKVARCFPGSQVYACGSRVRGDYVDFNEANRHEKIVIQARKAAGMKHREQSDFDFWVAPGAVQVGALPQNSERARLRIPESEKVAIPIYYG